MRTAIRCGTLTKLPGRVVGPDHRELAPRRPATLLDPPGQRLPAERVDLHPRGLSGADLGGLRFLVVGRHPDFVGHHEQQLRARGHELLRAARRPRSLCPACGARTSVLPRSICASLSAARALSTPASSPPRPTVTAAHLLLRHPPLRLRLADRRLGLALRGQRGRAALPA